MIAAGNEFESFQVAVEAGPSPIRGLRVDHGESLTGPGGATIPARNVTIYREAAYEVARRSDAEGDTGPWPDPLIPETDYLYGEDRSAFPIDVPAGDRIVAFVDVLVPPSAPAGEYSGTLAVRDAAGVIAAVPITATVLDLQLPSTTTLAGAFPVHPYQPCAAHTGRSTCDHPEEAWRLAALYARAGLENRVTISNPFPGIFGDGAEQFAPIAAVDQRRFERFIVPLINGEFHGLRLPGARLTSLTAYSSCVETIDPWSGRRCLADWRALADKHGFADRMFVYVCDEPFMDSAAWPECNRVADAAESLWPGVDRLITTWVEDATENRGLERTDVLAPVINRLADKPGADRAGDQRGAYDAFLDPAADPSGSPPNRLWAYTSCLSHSCDSSEGPYWNGWPGYAIDAPGSQARAMGALAWMYELSGELYYDVGASLETAWTDSYDFGGNGDGTLFYPGRPEAGDGIPGIGGTRDIPIESLRLKRIRDGREDYEFLRALTERGQGAEARAIVEGLYGRPDSAAFSTTVSQAALDAARCRLALALDGGRAEGCEHHDRHSATADRSRGRRARDGASATAG